MLKDKAWETTLKLNMEKFKACHPDAILLETVDLVFKAFMGESKSVDEKSVDVWRNETFCKFIGWHETKTLSGLMRQRFSSIPYKTPHMRRETCQGGKGQDIPHEKSDLPGRKKTSLST